MAGPLYSISSGAVQGSVWTSKFDDNKVQPSIRKAKRDMTGKYEKDENGKQLYTDFYNERDMLDLAFVAQKLYDFMRSQKATTNKADDEPKF